MRADMLQNPALMATKTSILIFYLRLSKITNKFVRITSYATLAVVNVAGLVLTFFNIFQCRPLSKTFAPNDAGQKCIPLITLYIVSAPINIVTDLAILALPIPILAGMHLPRKQKYIMAVTFGLGIFVTVVDVIRIKYLQQAITDVFVLNKSVTITHSLGAEEDFPYYASLALMWSSVEINVGIICACIPTLKPLVKRITPRLIGQDERDSGEKPTPPSTSSDNNSPDEPPAMEEFRRVSALEESPGEQRQPAAARSSQQAGMDLPEFLTGPGAESRRVSEAPRNQSFSDTSSSSSTYFGFINMGRPKSMLKLSARDSWKYCTVVTILFFLWGFSYGLLNTLNYEAIAASHSSVYQGLGLQSAYYGGYLVGPLTVGRYTLVRSGFKATFIVGLCIYGTGTLMFWPCAVLASYPGFIISNFVVGFGLAILETAANPFLALCGPPQYGEMRLLLAQGVEAVASIISQIINEKAFFRDLRANNSLINLQWTYLAIGLFSAILALIFYYMPLPEATDDELDAAARPRSLPLNKTINEAAPTTHIGRFRVIYVTLALGAWGQFFYVAMQENVSLGFARFIDLLSPPDGQRFAFALSKTNFILVGRGAFAAARFLAGGLCLLIRPRIILLAALVATAVITIAIVALPTGPAEGHPDTVAALIVVLIFFEGPVWPLIFALALRKLGRATKTGAALVTAGAFGGAISPWIVYGIEQAGVRFRKASFVVVIWSGLACLFPAYLCVVRRAREQVDCNGETEGEAGMVERVESRISRIGMGREKERGEGRGRIGSLGRGGDRLRRVSVASGKWGRRIVVGVKEWGRRISLVSLSSSGSNDKGRALEVENGEG